MAWRPRPLDTTIGITLMLVAACASAPARSVLKDSDGDGFLDRYDACPYEPGIIPDGCPERERDGDGFMDSQDACPDIPGISPDGCPEKDRDGDGFLDGADECPDEPGVEPDGCPIPDTDGDGLRDPEDRCVPQPETRNGFEDGDGCPDEIPRRLALGLRPYQYKMAELTTPRRTDFPGPRVRAALKRVAEVLREYPEVRIEVSVHSDSTGRIEDSLFWRNRGGYFGSAIKNYLVQTEGIADERIETRSAGPDEPVDTNKTAAGRAKNRRLEYTILVQ